MKKIILISVIALLSGFMPRPASHFRHILITNDDGIGDLDRLMALANAVKEAADHVSIFVADTDKSGSSNHTVLGKHQKVLEVKTVSVDSVNHITVYTTPGNPADCVLLALTGFFGDDRPDLVLSGINGGANAGPEWFGSGTIGAARMGSFLNAKSIAFSGCEDKDPAFADVLSWIGRFIHSPVVDMLGRNSYLTVGFPEDASAIKGVKLNERRVSCEFPENIVTSETSGRMIGGPGSVTTWTMGFAADPRDMVKPYDDKQIEEGYIVVTPMSIDENDRAALDKMKAVSLPAYR